LCISIVTAMSPVLYKVTSNYFLSRPVQASQMASSHVLLGPFFTILVEKRIGGATEISGSIFLWSRLREG
jgi:hypothetical protein